MRTLFLSLRLQLHLTLLVCLAATTVARSNDTAVEVGPSPVEQDELWLASTRHLGSAVSCGGSSDSSAERELHVEKCESGQWCRSSAEEFLSTTDPGKITVIYVHGFQADWNTALERGTIVQRILQRGARRVPIRLLIWSWPSERQSRILQDARQKIGRTEDESYYLARLISRMPGGAQLSLLGYSFGARIVAGALHLRGGGQLCDLGLAEPPASLAPVRTVLIAAAFDANGLQCRRRFSQAAASMDELLVLYNSRDIVLKRFATIERVRKEDALGFTGLATCNLPLDPSRIRQLDLRNSIGRSHAELAYYGACDPMREVRRVLLWQ